MNRISWCIAAGLVAATASIADAETNSAPEWPALGEMVDADLPATYRLPPVAIANNDSASITPATTPAVCPPDDGRRDAGSTIARGDVNASGGDATPMEVGRIDIAAREAFEGEARDRETVRTAAYLPVTADLTSQLLPAVQRGFGLAQRGALFAAREEFVQVLRRVAQAHDAANGTSEHSRALAAGLRALDEAEDFVPQGVQLEAELDVRTVASSHRTLVLPGEPAEVSAFEAAALYHSFAQERLRAAVASEQAGSMALYGLGIVYGHLAMRSDEDVQLTRSAITMHGAALAACPENHLAANELGVLVCRSGRADEAIQLFQHTINFAPSALAYHNLAMAQQQLGMHGQAAANETESQRLAGLERSRGEVSRRVGVNWVTPEEMAQSTRPVNFGVGDGNQRVPPETPKSAWQKVVDSTKALRPGGMDKPQNLGPEPAERVARPMSGGNQTQWR
jgi:tetratricopeptide (TPR) repeat protein